MLVHELRIKLFKYTVFHKERKMKAKLLSILLMLPMAVNAGLGDRAYRNLVERFPSAVIVPAAGKGIGTAASSVVAPIAEGVASSAPAATGGWFSGWGIPSWEGTKSVVGTGLGLGQSALAYPGRGVEAVGSGLKAAASYVTPEPVGKYVGQGASWLGSQLAPYTPSISDEARQAAFGAAALAGAGYAAKKGYDWWTSKPSKESEKVENPTQNSSQADVIQQASFNAGNPAGLVSSLENPLVEAVSKEEQSSKAPESAPEKTGWFSGLGSYIPSKKTLAGATGIGGLGYGVKKAHDWYKGVPSEAVQQAVAEKALTTLVEDTIAANVAQAAQEAIASAPAATGGWFSGWGRPSWEGTKALLSSGYEKIPAMPAQVKDVWEGTKSLAGTGLGLGQSALAYPGRGVEAVGSGLKAAASYVTPEPVGKYVGQIGSWIGDKAAPLTPGALTGWSDEAKQAALGAAVLAATLYGAKKGFDRFRGSEAYRELKDSIDMIAQDVNTYAMTGDLSLYESIKLAVSALLEALQLREGANLLSPKEERLLKAELAEQIGQRDMIHNINKKIDTLKTEYEQHQAKQLYSSIDSNVELTDIQKSMLKNRIVELPINNRMKKIIGTLDLQERIEAINTEIRQINERGGNYADLSGDTLAYWKGILQQELERLEKLQEEQLTGESQQPIVSTTPSGRQPSAWLINPVGKGQAGGNPLLPSSVKFGTPSPFTQAGVGASGNP